MADNKDKEIQMKPINKDGKTDADKMKEMMLAEGDDVMIWCDNNLNDKSIFINIGNATISMPEQVFYELTKLTQISAKALLGVD